MSAFNASKQKLTPGEEYVLVNFILALANRALPLTCNNIIQHANAILEEKGRDSPDERVGEMWVGRFLKRWHNKLQTHWSCPLATERAKSLNPEAVKHWFELMKTTIVNEEIKPHNIYGMDKSGFPPSRRSEC